MMGLLGPLSCWAVTILTSLLTERSISAFLATNSSSEPRWSRRRSPGQPGGCPARPGGGAAPGGLLASLELLSSSNQAWNFPNFAKTLKSNFLLTFVMFSYHNSYLSYFCSCLSLKPGCNMFFIGTCIYHVCIHIYWITCHIMFESVSIYNLRFGAFEIIDLDGTGPIYFFNMKRSFPSGK